LFNIMMSALSTVLSAAQILQLYNAYSRAKKEVRKFLKWCLVQTWALIVLFFKSLIRPFQFMYVCFDRTFACSLCDLEQRSSHVVFPRVLSRRQSFVVRSPLRAVVRRTRWLRIQCKTVRLQFLRSLLLVLLSV